MLLKLKEDGHFELIVGHIRLEALKSVGDCAIPAIVIEVSEESAVKAALIENLARNGLNPIEKAKGLQQLKKLGINQKNIAELLEIKEPEVSSLLAILELQPEVVKAQSDKEIGFGHLKALLPLKNNPESQRLVLLRLLALTPKERTVRKAEALVRAELARLEGRQVLTIELALPRENGVKLDELADSWRFSIEFGNTEELKTLLLNILEANFGKTNPEFPCGNFSGN